MFGLGFMEIIVIAVVGLLFVGPKRLPEVAKELGKFFVKFRNVTSEAREAVDDVVRQAERELAIDEAKKIREAIRLPDLDSLVKDKSLELLEEHEKSLGVEVGEQNSVKVTKEPSASQDGGKQQTHQPKGKVE